MNAKAEVDENGTIIGGTGSCTVSGCGCQAFVAAPGGSGTHCIGRNAAGGPATTVKTSISKLRFFGDYAPKKWPLSGSRIHESKKGNYILDTQA
jgi:hypothetical protein